MRLPLALLRHADGLQRLQATPVTNDAGLLLEILILDCLSWTQHIYTIAHMNGTMPSHVI